MIKTFSRKQRRVLSWWHRKSRDFDRDAIICDGSVRSGKTFCMSLSFVIWSFYFGGNGDFAICGKTIRSLRRNMITPITALLQSLGFSCEEKLSQNLLLVTYRGRTNRFYLFGGKDEASAALIQGMTLSGVLFDEVALMPRSFVEQALARCSVDGSRFWFNCNPEHPEHWFHLEWIKGAEQKNALYLHFTMDDNPSLSEEVKRRYESLYSGVFYERFVKGKWVAVHGAVYPFMADEKYYYGVPSGDFIRAVAVDPSAASFIEVIRRHGVFQVVPAQNNVVNGIRRVSQALKSGRIRICDTCKAARREFSLYRWDCERHADAPVKQNDHAMDDIRYFVTTLMDGGSFVPVIAAAR
ncbi:PBSX family phage terminase large subunit [uncultured Ruminococcus sp.]|uniref:PBSX family phage terminase large subunit n=1 Tax=uncultured Ruminococcus sp. TaxID=165186 RepID=UPI00292FAC08|nr:PBSX family phage terminase large subunit [uncultured Ruminococcus sp.]